MATKQLRKSLPVLFHTWLQLQQVSNNLAAHLQPAAPGRALGSRNGGIDSSEAASAAHTCVSCPSIIPTCCLLLKVQLQLIHPCSFLIYTSLERRFCRLCKNCENSFSLLVPFLAQGGPWKCRKCTATLQSQFPAYWTSHCCCSIR